MWYHYRDYGKKCLCRGDLDGSLWLVVYRSKHIYIVTFTYANDGSPFPRPLFDMRCVVMRENIMNGNSYDMVLDLLLIRYVFFDALFMPLL